jgi:hypothetical protein
MLMVQLLASELESRFFLKTCIARFSLRRGEQSGYKFITEQTKVERKEAQSTKTGEPYKLPAGTDCSRGNTELQVK